MYMGKILLGNIYGNRGEKKENGPLIFFNSFF